MLQRLRSRHSVMRALYRMYSRLLFQRGSVHWQKFSKVLSIGIVNRSMLASGIMYTGALTFEIIFCVCAGDTDVDTLSGTNASACLPCSVCAPGAYLRSAARLGLFCIYNRSLLHLHWSLLTLLCTSAMSATAQLRTTPPRASRAPSVVRGSIRLAFCVTAPAPKTRKYVRVQVCRHLLPLC